MTNHSIWLLASILLALGVGAPSTSAQDRPLKSDAEAYIRTLYEAWDSGDQKTIVQIADIPVGFGFRTLAPRGTTPVSRQDWVQRVSRFFESMEYYHLTLDEFHSAVHDDVVVAWGFHTEDFKVRGKSPEKVRVRFSVTIKKSQDGWDTLLVHRDIQRFDAEGRYIPREVSR